MSLYVFVPQTLITQLNQLQYNRYQKAFYNKYVTNICEVIWHRYRQKRSDLGPNDAYWALSSFFTNYKRPRVDGNALSAIVSFINPNKSIHQLKHVVSKAAICKTPKIRKSLKKIICSKFSDNSTSHPIYLMIINCASFVRSFTQCPTIETFLKSATAYEPNKGET